MLENRGTTQCIVRGDCLKSHALRTLRLRDQKNSDSRKIRLPPGREMTFVCQETRSFTLLTMLIFLAGANPALHHRTLRRLTLRHLKNCGFFDRLCRIEKRFEDLHVESRSRIVLRVELRSQTEPFLFDRFGRLQSHPSGQVAETRNIGATASTAMWCCELTRISPGP